VRVTVNPGPSEIEFGALVGSDDLWQGQKMGKSCYLKKI